MVMHLKRGRLEVYRIAAKMVNHEYESLCIDQACLVEARNNSCHISTRVRHRIARSNPLVGSYRVSKVKREQSGTPIPIYHYCAIHARRLDSMATFVLLYLSYPFLYKDCGDQNQKWICAVLSKFCLFKKQKLDFVNFN